MQQVYCYFTGKSQIWSIPLKHWLDKISYGAIYSYFFKNFSQVPFWGKQAQRNLFNLGHGRVLTANKSQHTLSQSGSEGRSYESDRCTSDY